MTFCATTYRQTHRQNEDERAVLSTLRKLKRASACSWEQ